MVPSHSDSPGGKQRDAALCTLQGPGRESFCPIIHALSLALPKEVECPLVSVLVQGPGTESICPVKYSPALLLPGGRQRVAVFQPFAGTQHRKWSPDHGSKFSL